MTRVEIDVTVGALFIFPGASIGNRCPDEVNGRRCHHPLTESCLGQAGAITPRGEELQFPLGEKKVIQAGFKLIHPVDNEIGFDGKEPPADGAVLKSVSPPTAVTP